MSTWDLWGIGTRTAGGGWGGGGGIASAPPSPRRRESGAAMLSSIRARSTSPVTARMSPSGPTWASWNETMSPLRIRRTRDGSPLGSRPYGWSFGKTSRDTSRTARWCVSSASMRRSFCSSARIRRTSFGGNPGSGRKSTKSRPDSAAVSSVHPLSMDGRADLLRPDFLDPREERLREVPRAEAFARAEQHALEGDAVLLVPRPGADLLVGPREFRLRRGRPFQLLDFPVEYGLDAVQGGAGRQRRVRDEQGGVQLRLEADPDVRRELRVDEGPIQAVRPGPPVAPRQRGGTPPPPHGRPEGDERPPAPPGRARGVAAD